MKMNLLKFNDAQVLTRAQMKNVKGGSAGTKGTRCVYYCCPSSCSSPFLIIDGITCENSEQCQGAASGDNPCGSGDYLAALCKG